MLIEKFKTVTSLLLIKFVGNYSVELGASNKLIDLANKSKYSNEISVEVQF